MSKAQELYTNVTSGNLSLAINAYKDYLISHCAHPQVVRIFDAHTMSYRKIKVPCGHCYHCMESKINEWVTRMYAHLEDYKYVYFITLTYTSFYRNDSPVTNLLLNKLSQAVWHYDSFNSLNKYCYRPTLLCKSHYQNFFKRLRKNTNNDSLTYVVCGEYGKKYGSPHFHAILFSNVPISESDIKRAWSVCLWRDDVSGNWSYRTNQRKNGHPYDVLIGRIDYNDLVQNGTCNTAQKIKVDNSYLGLTQCFSYVCKYVCKRDDANLKRVYLAYNSLWKKQSFVKIYDNEVQYSLVKQYLQDIGYPITSDKRSLYNDKVIEELSYEKFIPFESEKILSKTLFRSKKINVCGHQVSFDLFPKYVKEFVDLYSPFVEFSRSTPIGSIYAKSHLSEFVQGVFNCPILQTKGFVVPRYFLRKADESVYGLRQIHKTAFSSSLSLGKLPSLQRYFEDVCEGKILFPYRLSGLNGSTSLSQVLSQDSKVFVDKFSGTRSVIGSLGTNVYSYKFDRSSRSYRLVEKLPVKEWLEKWLLSLSDEYERYYNRCKQSQENWHYEEAAVLSLNDDVNVSELTDHIQAAYKSFRDDQQKIYDNFHQNVDF